MTAAPRQMPQQGTDADHVALWLMSPDGEAMMAREMRRCGCPESFDSDLARMTMRSADQMVARGEPIESVPAWTTLTFRRRVMDLLHAPAHRQRVAVTDIDGQSHPGTAERAVDGVDSILAGLELAEIRRHVMACHPPQQDPWPVSAGLTFLSIAVEGCLPGRTCPAPAGATDEYDAAHWAALFYANVTGCFAGAGADTAATRQRRKRRIDTVRAALAAAYVATTGSGDDRG